MSMPQPYSEPFDIYSNMIEPLHEWHDNGVIKLPCRYSNVAYNEFDVWFLKIFGDLDPNFKLDKPIPCGRHLPAELKQAFSVLQAGDWRWMAGPHGYTIYRAMLAQGHPTALRLEHYIQKATEEAEHETAT